MDNLYYFSSCRKCIYFRKLLNYCDYECADCLIERMNKVDQEFDRGYGLAVKVAMAICFIPMVIGLIKFVFSIQ